MKWDHIVVFQTLPVGSWVGGLFAGVFRDSL